MIRRHGPYPPVTHIGRFSFQRTAYVPWWYIAFHRPTKRHPAYTLFLPGVCFHWKVR